MTESKVKKEAKKAPSTQAARKSYHEDQIRFFSGGSGDGKAVQNQLARARVAVFGGGAVASHLIASLADSGVGSLIIVDGDDVTNENVGANALLTSEDAGKKRAAALAAAVSRRTGDATRCATRCEAAQAGAASIAEIAQLIKGIDCAVAAVDSPAPALLDAVNAAALTTGTAWLAVQVYRGIGLIGPAVLPGQSPCFKCYELRRNANLVNYDQVIQYEEKLREMKAIRGEFIAPRPLAACIGGHAGLEVLRVISRRAVPQTVGKILRIDFFAPEMTYHRILRFPNCPACGNQ